jgi:hypothetical protein
MLNDVVAVLLLYVDLPDTPLRPGPRDHSLARQLYEQGVPISLVESALLLGSLRRLMRPADLPPLSPIRSLGYFQPVITELQQQPLPEGYLDYLRLVAAITSKDVVITPCQIGTLALD